MGEGWIEGNSCDFIFWLGSPVQRDVPVLSLSLSCPMGMRLQGGSTSLCSCLAAKPRVLLEHQQRVLPVPRGCPRPLVLLLALQR